MNPFCASVSLVTTKNPYIKIAKYILHSISVCACVWFISIVVVFPFSSRRSPRTAAERIHSRASVQWSFQTFCSRQKGDGVNRDVDFFDGTDILSCHSYPQFCQRTVQGRSDSTNGFTTIRFQLALVVQAKSTPCPFLYNCDRLWDFGPYGGTWAKLGFLYNLKCSSVLGILVNF